MILRDKIDQAIIDDLKLDSQTNEPYFPGLDQEREINEQQQEPTLAALEEEEGYDSLQLVDYIQKENRNSLEIKELRIKAQTESDETWTLRDGLLLRQGKLYVTEGKIKDTPLRTAIIREVHAQPLSGHPGIAKLKQLVNSRYYWPGLGNDIDQYCANCHICRRSHVPRDKKPGFLQQLPVPDRPWQHITIDFKKCPESKTKHNMVAIFVDRLGKRPITVPVRDTITAKELVPVFLMHVARHVGLPDSIVTDCGPQFISDFWNEVCKRLKIKVKLSTANHPQTDGQTEIVNQYFDQRLRPYINYYQDDWDKWVAMFDYQQAALWHETTGQSPFMTEKGYEPRTSFDWDTPVSAHTPKERLNQEEAKALVTRLHESWERAKSGMTHSQKRYAIQANKHRRAINFRVGDKVWVSTKHWTTDRPSKKLANQMDGPYEILEQISHSFRLRLPESIKVHPVFHADRLRKDPDNPLEGQSNPDPPPLQVNDQEEYEVQEILAVKQTRGKLRYKIKWKGWDDDPEYYPASVLSNSPLALQRFHEVNPDRLGPPKNLQYWLDCVQSDVFPDTRDDDE